MTIISPIGLRTASRALLVALVSCAPGSAAVDEVLGWRHDIALSSAAKRNNHIESLGEEAGIWGNLKAGLEGWAYPFKLFEELHLAYSVDSGETFVPESELAETQISEPHLTRLLVVDDRFHVERILFAPRRRPGLIVMLKVATTKDLHVRMRFRPRLVPMLMKEVAPIECKWNAQRHRLDVRSPAPLAASFSAAFPKDTDHRILNDGSHEFQFSIPTGDGDNLRAVVFEAEPGLNRSNDSLTAALADNVEAEIRKAWRHYQDLLNACPRVVSPDRDVNRAMSWSAVSLDQLRVRNPDLGYGIVSGYSSSGTSTRPRYAWFFDEPTLASHAFLRIGLDGHVREAFRMLQSHQRSDGKTVHEINQSLRYQPDFFDTYKYAYVHTDGPVYFLAGCGHYYRSTGDLTFIRQQWPRIKKTFAWCCSRLDRIDGLITVARDDWGTVEVATAIEKDTQLQAMWIKALREVTFLADVMGDQSVVERCQEIEHKATRSLASKLWDEENGFFLWGLTPNGQPLRSLIPHHGIGIWMGSHPQDHARRALRRLAAADFRTDWGVRSLATSDPRYSAGAYQTGTVWPVWNAGVIIGDYMHGRHHDGFRNWRSMIDLRQIGGLGPMPEVLHGRFCKRTNEGVPHQLFSEVAVQNGFYDGLLGLEVNIPKRILRLAPALPPHWPRLDVEGIPVGHHRADVSLKNQNGRWECRLTLETKDEFTVSCRPRLPAGSRVTDVRVGECSCEYSVNQRPTAVEVDVQRTRGDHDCHIIIEYEDGIDFRVVDPPLVSGQRSERARLIEASFAKRTWSLELEAEDNVSCPLEFHAASRPVGIVNARLLGGSGSVWRVEAFAPREDERSSTTSPTRWTTQVSWDE